MIARLVLGRKQRVDPREPWAAPPSRGPPYPQDEHSCPHPLPADLAARRPSRALRVAGTTALAGGAGSGPGEASQPPHPLAGTARSLQGRFGDSQMVQCKNVYGFIHRKDTSEDVFIQQTYPIKEHNPRKCLGSAGDGETMEGAEGRRQQLRRPGWHSRARRYTCGRTSALTSNSYPLMEIVRVGKNGQRSVPKGQTLPQARCPPSCGDPRGATTPLRRPVQGEEMEAADTQGRRTR